MEKNILTDKLFFIFPLLFTLNCVLFTYVFVEWIIVLYVLSVVINALLFFAVFGRIFKNKNSDKPKKKAVICSVATAVFIFGITYIVNNVIYGEKEAETAVIIIVAITAVLFAIMYFISAGKGVAKKIIAVVCSLLCVLCSVIPVIKDTEQDEFLRVASPVGTGTYLSKETEKVADADFYISPNGDDSADGSFEHPFLSFDRAKEAVRELDKTDRKEIKVAVMAGEYRVEQICFEAEDGGSKECPVTYCAYGDGEVVINGGASLESSDFKKVTDEKMLERLSENARENVLCIDLSDYGISAEDYGKIYTIGSYNTAEKYDGDYVGEIYCELFVNDERMTLARYPDKDNWLYTEKVVETGEGKESDGSLTVNENWDTVRNPKSDVYGISKKLADRIAGWATLDDVWMFGFWKYDWADASTPIGNFDYENRTLSTKFVSLYGTKEDAPYYFFNVFEELDTPGEWYLDRENAVLYLYPTEDFGNGTVDLSLTDKTLIVSNGDYITIDDFTVKGTRADAFLINANGNTVKNCLMKNIAGSAIKAYGYDNLITENEITRTGCAGITVSGGDVETLTPGNSRADNNLIHDWSEINMTYQAAVTLEGCGNTCSHNEIYNSPHEAITYSGNNHIIEYNLIHDVCLLSDDAGAIYSGRSWCWYGDVIRYNCIYNLGSGDHKPVGIYLDDALSGQTVYGNLLINIEKLGIQLGGGRDLDVRNNIVVNTNDNPFTYDQRAIDGVFGGWFTHSSEENGDMWQTLFSSAWQSEIWQTAFPQMKNFSSDFSNTDNPGFVPNPANSIVTGNAVFTKNGSFGDISEKALEFSNISDNAVYSLEQLSEVFTDAQNGNYTLKENSVLFDSIPGFEEIPVKEIGRY